MCSIHQMGSPAGTGFVTSGAPRRSASIAPCSTNAAVTRWQSTRPSESGVRRRRRSAGPSCQAVSRRRPADEGTPTPLAARSRDHPRRRRRRNVRLDCDTARRAGPGLRRSGQARPEPCPSPRLDADRVVGQEHTRRSPRCADGIRTSVRRRRCHVRRLCVTPPGCPAGSARGTHRERTRCKVDPSTLPSRQRGAIFCRDAQPSPAKPRLPTCAVGPFDACTPTTRRRPSPVA